MLKKYKLLLMSLQGINFKVMAKRKKKMMKNPCWKGYKAYGMKKKGGKMVPNCVPLKKKK